MNYYAHSKKEEPVEHWQLLEDHLKNVADLSSEFAQPFADRGWGNVIAYLHDIGKMADEFQAYLLRENGFDDSEYNVSGRINHSTAGAVLAKDRFQGQLGIVLGYIIAGHHAGLPDWSSETGGRGALPIRLSNEQGNLNAIRERIACLLPSDLFTDKLELPSFVIEKNLHFWMRMLYSALVDADFLDTEAFMSPEKKMNRSGFDALPCLKKKFDDYMSVFQSNLTRNGKINKIRSKILDACLAKASEAPGLFSLTVPTGGGKTLSSMGFALNHAIKYKKQRIIYVIPYTSIIEQTADVFADVFGRRNIVEHHCNIDVEKETQQSQLASENWDAPIVITTSVQFFESIYAAKSSRCRKLHNLVNSVIILDEAQLIPPKWLFPCVTAINELSKNYGCTLVLTTATQPKLPHLDKVNEIIPEDLTLYDSLKRVEYIFPDEHQTKITLEQVAEDLLKHDQVLCIVNCKRDCYDLCQLIPEGTIHLSTNMCGKHRMAKISKIKELLKANKPVRVISTQLVEAGVDIDFPVVYRAYAGLDSIAQAAGRCNREGKLSRLGKVVVFNPPQLSPPGLLRKGEDTCRELAILKDFNPHSPSEFKRYFELYYGKLNDIGTRWYNEHLVRDANLIEIQFRKAGSEFSLIGDDQKTVFVIYDKSVELIEKLRKNGPDRELMRRLQRYAVSLYDTALQILLNDGKIEEIWDGIYIQLRLCTYDDTTGLAIYESDIPPDKLITG